MRRVTAAGLDVVLVVVFSAFGRGAHAEGLGLGEIWSTAWVFLSGLAAGWLALLAWRSRPEALRSGVVVWLATLVVGMTIYGLRAGEVPHWSFLIVAGTVTGAFLLGWRLVARRVLARRATGPVDH